MSVMDKLWDAFSTVIKMNAKVIAQAAAMTDDRSASQDRRSDGARDSSGNHFGDCPIDQGRRRQQATALP
jgi:hypothetical protein